VYEDYAQAIRPGSTREELAPVAGQWSVGHLVIRRISRREERTPGMGSFGDSRTTFCSGTTSGRDFSPGNRQMRHDTQGSQVPALVLLGLALVSPVRLSAAEAGPAVPYAVVDTGQVRCYDQRNESAPPQPGRPFFGQDAQFQGHLSSYMLSADGLTVQDKVTGLTWQRRPDTDGNGVLNRADKLTLSQARALPATLNAARFGGYADWRLPSIKELYSLFDGRGTDPSGNAGTDTAGLIPFIDRRFFGFVYGDTGSGERVIDSQYASGTTYVGKSPRGGDKLFGVNFADGRIKGYDLQMPGGAEKGFFVICVRGNPAYGRNDFHDNGDGTITDRATGLMWAQADSAKGLDWQEALAWVQRQNAARFLGHGDWRLPDVKELQSIVDYTRSPDTTHSAASDPLLTCSPITNEGGQADYPCYWSSTTHAGGMGGGAAMYVAFGRAAGWLSARALAGGPPERQGGPGGGAGRAPGAEPAVAGSGEYRFVDVHGAGAQRSDPKAGDQAQFPHGRGPQGDVIRIANHVRLVRGGDVVRRDDATAPAPASRTSARGPEAEGPPPFEPGPGAPRPPSSPLVSALDRNGDGVIDAGELGQAAESLKRLDKNGDGRISCDEYRPQFPGGPGPRGPGGRP
jgi:hypothetical protein